MSCGVYELSNSTVTGASLIVNNKPTNRAYGYVSDKLKYHLQKYKYDGILMNDEQYQYSLDSIPTTRATFIRDNQEESNETIV